MTNDDTNAFPTRAELSTIPINPDQISLDFDTRFRDT
jgi:hypothetical protein